jgi:CRISPR/Cas system CSM-associated protein Csm3 (group 7 of RAMP superfamily)
MHRVTHNELRLDFAISTASPLCIQVRNSSPMRFVRTLHPSGGESVYIPGATLKGALRQAAEHVIRGANLDCCDTDHPCSEREQVKRANGSPALYRALCLACRLFGSPVLRSHLTVTDSFPAEPVNVLRGRDTAEMVQDETFYGTLSLRNFERWHVGLLALLISRINLADVQIGARRSEGMGCVVMRYTCLTLLYPGPEPDEEQQEALRTRLFGVGQLMGHNTYGYAYPDVSGVPDLPEEARFDMGVGYSVVTIVAEETEDSDGRDESHYLIDNVLTNQALAWGSYVRTHKAER